MSLIMQGDLEYAPCARRKKKMIGQQDGTSANVVEVITERKKINRMEADIVRFKENVYWNPDTHICYKCKHFGECRTHSFMASRVSVVECNRFEKE